MSSVLPLRDAELVKRPRGRLDSGRQRGSVGEVKRRRDRRIVGQHRQLGLGRPLGGQAEHAIADGHVRNALAELVDDTRRLVAQGLRELLVHQALALLPVARVDACRAHRDPDLAGTRMRIGQIHDLEDLRAPEPAETDCLHRCLHSRPRSVPPARPAAPARRRDQEHGDDARPGPRIAPQPARASRCECTPPDETVTGHLQHRPVVMPGALGPGPGAHPVPGAGGNQTGSRTSTWSP